MRRAAADSRRRRLRLIKSTEEQLADTPNPPVTVPILAIADEATECDDDSAVVRQELFEQCQGLASAILRVEHPNQPAISIAMDRPFLLIGRSSACDLRLDDEQIQEIHGFVQWIDGHLFCCDVSDQDGLSTRTAAPKKGCWLGHQPVPLGPYELTLESNYASQLSNDSPLDRSRELAEEYPRLGLQFAGVNQANKVWPVDRRLTLIGRAAQCKLRLIHHSVSPVQACLLRTRHHCWLIDLAQNGATSVNGQTWPVCPVEIGDLLQIGSFQIEVIGREEQPLSSASDSAKMKTKSADNSLQETGVNPLPDDGHASATQAQNQSPQDVITRSDWSVRVDEQALRKFGQRPRHIDGAVATEVIPLPESSAIETATAFVNWASVQSETSRLSDQSAALRQIMRSFVRQHQSRLEALKACLDELKTTYDQAAGTLVSKKLRDTLQQPVTEAEHCFNALQESLDRFQSEQDIDDAAAN